MYGNCCNLAQSAYQSRPRTRAQCPSWVTVHVAVARRSRTRIARLGALAFAVGLAAVSSALAAQTTHRAAVGADRGSREHQALLELYALDSRIAASRARVAYLAAKATRLRLERAALKSELRAVRSTLALAQRQLALQLRTRYERGYVDPLAVVFGADSFGQGLQALDDLKQVAA